MTRAILRWLYVGICAFVATGGFYCAISAWRTWQGIWLLAPSIASGVATLFALTVIWVAANWSLARWLAAVTGLLFVFVASVGLLRLLQGGGARTDFALFSLGAGLVGAVGISLALPQRIGPATERFKGPNRMLVQGGIVLAVLILSVSVVPAIRALSAWRWRLVEGAWQLWGNVPDLTESVRKGMWAEYSAVMRAIWGPALPAPSTRVVRLEVHAWHSGMVPSPDSHLVVSCEPQRCVTTNGEVAVELVESLFTAAIQPPLHHIDLANLGVSRDWVRRATAKERARQLRENPDKAAFHNSFGARLVDCAPRSDVLQALLTSYYDRRTSWTDDYPTVKVLMTLSSGATVKLSSVSQKQFMLPWKIATRSKSWMTYDARVSRSIAALLPGDFRGRYRIAGEGLANWYLNQFRHRSPAICGSGPHAP